MAKVRAIRVDSPSVTEGLDNWCRKYPRTKELWEGAMWRLCREPEKGYKFADNEFIYKIERPSEYFPYITIRYRYTDEEVIVLDIKLTPLF